MCSEYGVRGSKRNFTKGGVSMVQICEYCLCEVSEGCSGREFNFRDGVTLDPVKYGDDGQYEKYESNCPDCGCKKGSYHHLGCEIEVCPRCREKATSCKCNKK